MPEGTSGLAPPSSPLSLRLANLKKQRARGNRADRQRRRVTAHRLAEAERLLGAIIDGGDLLAEVTLSRPWCDERGVAVLVIMEEHRFRQLLDVGGALEDFEDTHDAELTDADEGEPTLGWHNGQTGHLEASTEDREWSLGSTQMHDQARWAEGHLDGEIERDDCDDEENGDNEHDQECEPSLVAADGHSMNNDGEERETDVPLPPEKVAAARARFRRHVARWGGL